MKLRYLLLVLFLPMILAFLGIRGFISYNTQSTTLISNVLENISEIILLKNKDISSFLHDAESDVLFLSELSSIEKLINIKDDDEEEIKIAKQAVEKDFLSFSDNKKIYYQVRYLDETGQEVVRINSDGYKIEVVKEDRLSNKKGRYYFDDAMIIDKGDISISPLDLNVENGEIEDRGFLDNPEYVPVIRYATPVFDKNKKSKGVILTNVYADQFLEFIDEDDKLFLFVNNDGFYLSHLDKSKEWGFMFDNEETFHKDYPSIAYKLMNEDSGQIFSKVDNNYFTFSRINNTNWTLISVDNKKSILEPAIIERNNIIFLSIIMFSAMSIFVVFISSLVSKPINQLTKVAKEISEGKLDVKIDDKVLNNKGEVGDLARAFERIFISLKLAMRKKSEE